MDAVFTMDLSGEEISRLLESSLRQSTVELWNRDDKAAYMES